MVARMVALLALCYCGTFASAGDADKAKLTAEEQRVLDATNELRKKEGLKPLQVSPLLTEVARKHSQTMAKMRKLEHVIDGDGPAQRLKKAGYKSLAYGENIEFNTLTGKDAADLAMKHWANSESHRKNLLDTDFTEIGIGMATNNAGEIYFTQVFGVPRK